MRRFGCRALVAFALWAVAACACAAAPAEPGHHLGVASCTGSTCHAAVKPIGRHPIRQDEYFIWQRQAAHAQAFNVLRSERSQGIARRLGLGDAAQADSCLACHTDRVSAASAGPRHSMTDGVGCETCHGGAEHWIASHVKGYASREAAIADGLYPTWEPQARAELCLSCHQGNAEKRMTHAMMAAGHPALLFELDTFGALRPAHHVVDADYIERKGAQDPTRNWIVGQAMAAQLLLEAIAQGRHQAGLFPELQFFDCDSCHHPMGQGRAQSARNGGLPAGSVPLADAALLTVAAWLDVTDPALAQRWRAGWTALYQNGYRDAAALRQQAGTQAALLRDRVLPLAKTSTADAAALRRMLTRLLDAGTGAHAAQFGYAEQTAMAALVLGSTMAERDGRALSASEKAAVDRVYAAIKNRDGFDTAAYRQALQTLRAAFRA